MAGTVTAIYISPNAGADLVSVDTAILQSGKGIVGDRYHSHKGTFSEKLQNSNDWQVTLIEIEEIQRYNQIQGVELPTGAFRRNIITHGMRLNDLVEEEFFVGDVLLAGMRLCEPCAHLGNLIGNSVVKAMVHRAGLRARIVKGGIIRSGDNIKR